MTRHLAALAFSSLSLLVGAAAHGTLLHGCTHPSGRMGAHGAPTYDAAVGVSLVAEAGGGAVDAYERGAEYVLHVAAGARGEAVVTASAGYFAAGEDTDGAVQCGGQRANLGRHSAKGTAAAYEVRWRAPGFGANVTFRVTTATGKRGAFRTAASAVGLVPPAVSVLPMLPHVAVPGLGRAKPLEQVFVWHGVLMAAAFGLALPAGAVASRHLRVVLKDGMWLTAHVALAGAAAALALVGALLVWQHEASEGAGHLKNDHAVYGALLLVLFAYQPLNGLLRPPAAAECRQRRRWEAAHKALGVVVLVGGLYVVLTGLEEAQEHTDSRSPTVFWWLFLAWSVLVVAVEAGVEVYLKLSDARGGGFSELAAVEDSAL